MLSMEPFIPLRAPGAPDTGPRISGEGMNLVLVLRIIAYALTLPSIFLFFYVIILAIDYGLGGLRGGLAVILALAILSLPVIFNRLAKRLEKNGAGGE